MRAGLHLTNGDPCDPYSDVILHVCEETAVVDGGSGLPIGAEHLREGTALRAWVGPVMMMSLPPQLTAEVVVAGLPEGMAAELCIVAEAEQGADGVAVTAVDGKTFMVPSAADIAPWRTRQLVRLEDITAGRKILVWQDEAGAVTRVVLFP